MTSYVTSVVTEWCGSSVAQFINESWVLDLTTLCLKKTCHLLTCCHLYIHDAIMIIFGRNDNEKVRNETMLCFPTSPIYCFTITLQERKPRRQCTSACVCNRVQLLESSSPEPCPRNSPKLKMHWLQDLGSHTAAWVWDLTLESKRLKKSSS